jgi:hypothetical protein
MVDFGLVERDVRPDVCGDREDPTLQPRNPADSGALSSSYEMHSNEADALASGLISHES